MKSNPEGKLSVQKQKMIIDKIIFSKHLEKEEQVLYAVHRHWIEISKETLEIAFFGFLLPWTLYAVGFNTRIFFWVAVTWSCLAYLRFLGILLDWYCDTWLVTDKNIITIQWNGVFSNLSSRIGFEDVEGAGYEIKGFWATLFRYGNMTLRVMSGGNFTLKNVRNPKEAELAIARFQGQYINHRNLQDTTSLKTLLSDLVARQVRHDK